jgi:AmiR/NasT family two-component response regulator
MPATDASTVDSVASPAQQVTVLIADDDRLVLTTLSQGLRAAGFATIEAHSGSEALKYCMQSPPSIAILDYDMPDVSGLEIAKTLRVANAFPFIFLSAYGDDEIVRNAGDTGAMAYLLKPIDPLHVIPVIRTALQRFSELRALRGQSVQLTAALQTTRDTSTVVGLLMERLHLSDKDAYDCLRKYARSQSRKVADVASDILTATGKLNTTINDIGLITGKTQSRSRPS